ncbi:hypothetical protein [Candidatus Methylacidiphilum infernorum]|uniref:Glycosyltransferase n=1 Tax=Methylacidiphilum infernorum (isolate V4) TaxID=481448 RepID=B3DZJ8_METI4|nr:hypothetical protein [Candidatus Methylacidiphilum infernorum]ACD82615.1 Conserved hypothetical protein [Methylacidiphilum infernorum V4]
MDVHGLICHRDVATGIICYKSLVQNSQEKLELILHDDGSLTEEDVAILQSSLPIKKVFLKKEADSILEEILSRYPACATYRKKQPPWGIKVFDIPLLEKNDVLAYCDSDLFFFKPFKGLFSFPGPKTNIILMYNAGDEPSCIRPWHFFMYPNLHIISNANAGILCIRKKCFDFDLLEWFMAQNWPLGFLFLYEQTFFALLAARIGGALYNPAQIKFPTKKEIIHLASGLYPEALAFHFVGGTKEYVKKYLSNYEPQVQYPITQIQTMPCKNLNFITLTWAQLKRKIKRSIKL